MSGTMIPKELLPIIGNYVFPSVDEFCSSLTESDKKLALKRIINSYDHRDDRDMERFIDELMANKRQRFVNNDEFKEDCFDILKLSEDNINQLLFLHPHTLDCNIETDENTYQLMLIFVIQQCDDDVTIFVKVSCDNNDTPVDVCVVALLLEGVYSYTYSTNTMSDNVPQNISSLFASTVKQARLLGDFIEDNRRRGVYNENEN